MLAAAIFVVALAAGVSAVPAGTVAKRALPSGWTLYGCILDDSARALDLQVLDSSTLTQESCVAACAAKGYSWAGAEFGTSCYCGSSQPSSSEYPLVSTAQCNSPCAGNAHEACGAAWRLTVFKDNNRAGPGRLPNSATTASFITTSNKASARSAPPSATRTSSISATPTSSAISKTISTTARLPVSAISSTAKPSVFSSASISATTSARLTKASSGPKLVVAHFIVGNTYPYTSQDWLNDINLAHAKGIDAFALNFGVDPWQPAQLDSAYQAAIDSGTGFKLFLSFDVTSLSCSSMSDAASFRSFISRYANSPAQLYLNDRPLVSTFSGESCTFGQDSVNDGWLSVIRDPSVPPVHFIPAFFVANISTLPQYTATDGNFNWDGGWPKAPGPVNFSLDAQHIAANGGKFFMASASPWFFTHYSSKNWWYGGDYWLYNTRWEQLIANRAAVDIVEVVTWNDFGESHYVSPIEGAQPNSQAWVDGYDHTAFLDMGMYYIQAFKTGRYPAITKDAVYITSRPHAHDAIAANDGLGRPLGWDWTVDSLWAVVFATAPGTLALTSGSNTTTFPASAGVNKFSMPSLPGGIRATLRRNGQTVVDVNPGNAFSYTTTPSSYNYNVFIASGST